MRFHLHLFRRGNVFQWRRRIPAQSTGTSTIQVSLRTTELKQARILARRLTAESDRMLDAIREETLSPADARKWLRHVVSEELIRIRKNRAIIFADGGADDCADWAMAQAWSMLARRGPKAALDEGETARLEAEGRSADEIFQLEISLDILGQEVRSEPHMRRLERAYRELTGADGHIPAHMLLILRKHLIEGRAAAWAQAPADQGLEIATELATIFASDMLEEERAMFLNPVDLSDGKVAAACPTTPSVATTQSLPEAKALSAPQPEPLAPEPVLPSFTAEPQYDEPVYDPTISAVIERLIAQKAHVGISSGTQKQYRSFANLFEKITGISDVRAIRKAHVATFRDTLQKMPKHWGKSPKDSAATYSEMMARARKLAPKDIGLEPGTINRHLDHLAHMLDQADNDGIHIDRNVRPQKLRVKETKRDRDKRSSFREPELKQLFQHTIWQGCKSARFRNSPGDLIIKDGRYWLPILAAYTGARREELAALTVADVRVEDGIHFFHIEANDNRRVKNFSSVRRVPLHHRLIALGFLDHIEEAKGCGPDLFPELRPNDHVKGAQKKYGKTGQYVFSTALKIVFDGNPRKLCLHSMRHFARDQLALDTSVPDKVRYDLIGHEMDDVDSRTYGEASPLAALRDAVNKLPVVV